MGNESFMLTEEDTRRYSRQVQLPEIGLEGQLKIASGRVMVAGLGGLGSIAAYYLAAAGVGLSSPRIMTSSGWLLTTAWSLFTRTSEVSGCRGIDILRMQGGEGLHRKPLQDRIRAVYSRSSPGHRSTRFCR